ncbi:Fe-S oxidoreductase [Mycetocola zhadangensis]|uniref:Fe-S oxidoreductase n=1 Tax=Mycetocola zhadangensis TaxID=1164595 RepID=A0A3L7ITT1_9MICO|nr:Fe-S oxidoreductase [Mycetocola zhadangensis]RLQ81570.1 Fe-S oxidoreductase [Mycetocola zhadangensis]
MLSRAGYLYATAVGFTWGAIWSTGRIRRRNGLFVFTGMPHWTFGRGGSCVGGCYLTNRNVSSDVLEHEAVHKRQWQRYGMLFPILYFFAGRDPLRNRFEIEAGLEKGGYIRPSGGSGRSRIAASGND